MKLLRFSFAGLHPDAPDLRGDLDWLLRFVAGKFEVEVGEEVLFEEVDFPVIELAGVLDAWVAHELPERRALDYEVTGGAPGDAHVPAHGRRMADRLGLSPD